MRETSYTDSKGRHQAVSLPEGLPDSAASLGLPVGPPCLESLGLPQEVEVRLHNQLFARRIFTAREAQARRQDVFAALQASYKVDAQRIIQVYLDIEKGAIDVSIPPKTKLVQQRVAAQRGGNSTT